MIRESDFEDQCASLLDNLGVQDLRELPGFIQAMGDQESNDRPIRVIFVVDALDRYADPADPFQDRAAALLGELEKAARLIITCRSEVWDAWYRNKLDISSRQVRQLDRSTVETILAMHTEFPPASANDLLQVPFFLDLVIQKKWQRRKLPAAETEFLNGVWLDAASPENSGKRWFLETLARKQFEQLCYEVELPGHMLKNEPGFTSEVEQGIDQLVKEGVCVRPPHGGGTRYRLRHDLLDNFSIVRQLLPRQSMCLDLVNRCEKDCGWSLLASLIQALWDNPKESGPGSRSEERLDLIFERMLFVLDHKKFKNEPFMSRSWAVTHVLRAKFSVLSSRITAALNGELAESLDSENHDHRDLHRSRLQPVPELTIEAASTLGSCFVGMPTEDHREYAAAVPVLARCLEKLSSQSPVS